MNFVAMLINLDMPNQKVRLTAQHGIYAHAAIVAALSEIDIEAAKRLHDMKRHKQMTIAVLHEKGHTPALRLTFFNNDGVTYANLLINSLAQNSKLLLGKTNCQVKNIDISDQRWCGIQTWSDFWSKKSGSRFGFRFVTPAAFTKNDGNGQRYTALLPESKDIFLNLARRWQELGGPPLMGGLENFIESGGCVVSSFWLRTLKFQHKERTQIGFVGQAVYECRTSDPKTLQTFTALTRMAPFVGIGYQTARGLGTVQVKILG